MNTMNSLMNYPGCETTLSRDVLLQFEDFAQKNAMPLLNRYRNEIILNDDVGHCGGNSRPHLIAAGRAAGGGAARKKWSSLAQVRAGWALQMIVSQTQARRISEEAARQKVFMVGIRFGLLTDRCRTCCLPAELVQKPGKTFSDWDTESDVLSLLDVVRNVKPDILIGVSGQAGCLRKEIVGEMHKRCPRPIVMPL
ncbi:malic enzyme-like NAD(P)-binding protein [Escherichia coli]